MSHPIHQANENSPFGNLTRDEFYKKHQILHKQSFMLNKRNMKIFTQKWVPDSIAPTRLRGVVAMIHGYKTESTWIFELTAVAIAKLGFIVCSLDIQGHGYSEGLQGHIPKIQPVIDDCTKYFDYVKSEYPKLPSFLYGESLGGAISTLIVLKQKGSWNGLVLNGALCGISKKFKPVWPVEHFLPLAAFLAPNWRIVVSKPLKSKSYKEEWKRNLVSNNPNRRIHGKPPAATALEFTRICEVVRKRSHELELPLLIVHGEDDLVSDSNSAKLVYESSKSTDKTLKIFPGMWHMLIGEPKENVDLVFETIFSWLQDRADKIVANTTKTASTAY
ncbi:hypothetical protein MKW92_048159 [Papaver armeniacum]|nr:hypothetical protein MKW92_048159 [Papaver armeniacum]